MKYIFLIIIIFMTLGTISAAEYTQTIRGIVIDKHTRRAMPGATLTISGGDKIRGGITDSKGKFKIEGLPLGRYSIKVTYTGYTQALIPNIELSSARELVLNIEIEESAVKGKAVKVTAGRKANTINRSATVSARSFSVEETQRYAGSVMDPARLAANFAGVIVADDQRNDIIIRGNSPTGLLWRLEGISIPNPNHFASSGATGGGVSILNNNNLDNSDFFTGAFPAEYGNANAGVFDLRLKKGNDEKHQQMVQLGVMGLELGAEGPLPGVGGAAYICNYRYSTMQAVDALGLGMELPGIPKYQDLVFNINLPGSEKYGKFKIFGMGGMSNMGFRFKEQDDDDYDDYDQHPWTNSDDSHLMGVFGFSNTILLSGNSYVQSSFAITGFENKLTVDTILSGKSSDMIEYSSSSEMKYVATINLSHKFNAANIMTLGATANYCIFDYLDSSYNSYEKHFVTRNDYDGSSSLIELYGQLQHKFSDMTELTAGVHYQYLGLNNSYALEPRLGLTQRVSSVSSISFGAGMHSQAQPYLYYLCETGDTEKKLTNFNLGFSKSAHAVLGYDHFFGQDFRLKSELYYQYLYEIPVERKDSYFSMLNVGADFMMPFTDSLVNTGTGYNYGWELTLEKYFSNSYYYLITASVYDSKYKGSDDKERNTVFNCNYALTALGGTELALSQNSKLILDARITYIGGKRYVPVNLKASNLAGYSIYYEDQAYEHRYKDFFKLDLKFGFRINSGTISHFIMADISNVLNTKNIFGKYYNPATSGMGTMYQMSILPNIYYRIEF